MPPVRNCPFINNMAFIILNSYGHQTQHYKGNALSMEGPLHRSKANCSEISDVPFIQTQDF